MLAPAHVAGGFFALGARIQCSENRTSTSTTAMTISTAATWRTQALRCHVESAAAVRHCVLYYATIHTIYPYTTQRTYC